jgi:hypothetical protein
MGVLQPPVMMVRPSREMASLFANAGLYLLGPVSAATGISVISPVWASRTISCPGDLPPIVGPPSVRESGFG